MEGVAAAVGLGAPPVGDRKPPAAGAVAPALNPGAASAACAGVVPRRMRPGIWCRGGLAWPPGRGGFVAEGTADGSAPGSCGAAAGSGELGCFTPSFSNVRVISLPALFTRTLPAFSSMAKTSTAPSRWPSVRINDSSLLVAPGEPAGATSFNRTRLFPKIVVMPVKISLGNNGGALVTCGCSTGLRPNILRVGIDSYRFGSTSRTIACTGALNIPTHRAKGKALSGCLMLAEYTRPRGRKPLQGQGEFYPKTKRNKLHPATDEHGERKV